MTNYGLFAEHIDDAIKIMKEVAGIENDQVPPAFIQKAEQI